MAATKITFTCTCPQSVISVTVQSRTDPSCADAFVFKNTASGTKTMECSGGRHDVGYRALGTPGTDFALEVAKGGTMNPVSRTLPPDGRAAGNRELAVP